MYEEEKKRTCDRCDAEFSAPAESQDILCPNCRRQTETHEGEGSSEANDPNESAQMPSDPELELMDDDVPDVPPLDALPTDEAAASEGRVGPERDISGEMHELEELLRQAGREIEAYLEGIAIVFLIIGVMLGFILLLCIGFWKTAGILILLGVPAVAAALLRGRGRLRRRIDETHAPHIRELAGEIGLSPHELTEHIRLTCPLLKYVW